MSIRFERQRTTGLYLPAHISERRNRPTAFDFFAGGGGMSLGIISAGFEVVGANEWDAAAALTYMINLGSYPIKIHFIEEGDEERLDKCAKRWLVKDTSGMEYMKYTSGSGLICTRPDMAPVRNFWFGDVRQLRGIDILDALGMRQGDLDLVAGGPPCQGFSKAGKQNIADPRNNLVYEYARLIVELQPKTFIMEEVPDIVNFFDPDGVPVLDKFCLMIAEGGYGKWDNIRKALLMQSGSAGVIKSGIRGNARVQPTIKAKTKQTPVESRENLSQGSLF